MSRRLMVVVLAVVLGIVGTTSVAVYVRRADARATAKEQTTTVLAAKAPIPKGTSGAAAQQKGLVQAEQMPAKLVPTGALGDLSPVNSLLAVNDIPANQVLLQQMFAAPAQAAPTGPLTIPAGMIAATVPVSPLEQRVAGFATPGSEIAIFDVYKAATGTTTRMLVPRAQVLGVGASTPTRPQADPAIPGTLYTLGVSQNDAEKLIQASQTGGKLYFALLTPKSKTAPSAGVTNSTLFQ